MKKGTRTTGYLQAFGGWVTKWWRTKRLEGQLRDSESFQKYCEQNRFPSVAALERANAMEIKDKLRQFKDKQHGSPSL